MLPLHCPDCGSEMRLIAFVTETEAVKRILKSFGEPSIPPDFTGPLTGRSGTCLRGTKPQPSEASRRVLYLERGSATTPCTCAAPSALRFRASTHANLVFALLIA